jgi:hypothetical protein
MEMKRADPLPDVDCCPSIRAVRYLCEFHKAERLSLNKALLLAHPLQIALENWRLIIVLANWGISMH